MPYQVTDQLALNMLLEQVCTMHNAQADLALSLSLAF